MSTRHEAPRIVLFSGSRDWKDREPVRSALDSLPPGSLVIEGGAHGLDEIVRREAPSRGLHVATVRALWDYHGKSAGYRRNEAMTALGPAELFAYPLGESPGTRHMIRVAERECIQVREP
jgi:YspA, cpYpsA-related SLOG family